MSLVGYECDCVDRCTCFDGVGNEPAWQPTPQYRWNPRPYGTPLVHWWPWRTREGVGERFECGARAVPGIRYTDIAGAVTCESCRHAAKEER